MIEFLKIGWKARQLTYFFIHMFSCGTFSRSGWHLGRWYALPQLGFEAHAVHDLAVLYEASPCVQVNLTHAAVSVC